MDKQIEHRYTYHAWAEAFQIFAKYEDRYQVSAEHDIIYAGPSIEDVSDEDRAALDALGWHVDESLERFCHYV